MRFAGRSAGSSDIERKATLVGARRPTVSRSGSEVGFDRYVLCEPVENVGPMPADRLATVSALLRESSEDRQAQH